MFFSRKVYRSSKNGEIIVFQSLFETPSVMAQGCQQSGSYLVAMWKYMLSRVSSDVSVKTVLVLGLGGGDVIRLLQKKYKDAHITVVEWDDVMIDIFYALNKKIRTDKLTIQHEDAFIFLENNRDMFDIIIVDLFNGSNPPVQITEPSVLALLDMHVAKNGYVLTNFYAHIQYTPSFENVFLVESIISYKISTLGQYRKKSIVL